MTDLISTALVRAAELTAAGKPRKAVEVLRPILVTDPDNQEAWCRLAAAQLDAGTPEDSLESARHALRLGGDEAWAHRLCSLALGELGRQSEAVISAREAVRLRPEDWRAHITLAEALMVEAPARAVEAAQRAVDLAPHEPRTYEILGDTAAGSGQRDLAERAYRSALQLDARDDHARKGLAALGADRIAQRRAALPAPGSLFVPAEPEPEPPAAPEVLPGLEAVVWQGIRLVAVIGAAGTLLLLLAGLPTPSRLLAWFGVLLIVVQLWAGVRALRQLPPKARRLLPAVQRGNRLMSITFGLLGAATLLVLVWTVTVAFGFPLSAVLVLALLSAALAVGAAALGAWPHRPRVP